jgi:hypothetical protein
MVGKVPFQSYWTFSDIFEVSITARATNKLTKHYSNSNQQINGQLQDDRSITNKLMRRTNTHTHSHTHPHPSTHAHARPTHPHTHTRASISFATEFIVEHRHLSCDCLTPPLLRRPVLLHLFHRRGVSRQRSFHRPLEFVQSTASPSQCTVPCNSSNDSAARASRWHSTPVVRGLIARPTSQ